LFRRFSSHRLEFLPRLAGSLFSLRQASLPTVPEYFRGDDFGGNQFFNQLLEADRWIDDHRLRIGPVLQVRIVNGVEIRTLPFNFRTLAVLDRSFAHGRFGCLPVARKQGS
jgi:hypothetical protein